MSCVLCQSQSQSQSDQEVCKDCVEFIKANQQYVSLDSIKRMINKVNKSRERYLANKEKYADMYRERRKAKQLCDACNKEVLSIYWNKHIATKRHQRLAAELKVKPPKKTLVLKRKKTGVAWVDSINWDVFAKQKY